MREGASSPERWPSYIKLLNRALPKSFDYRRLAVVAAS